MALKQTQGIYFLKISWGTIPPDRPSLACMPAYNYMYTYTSDINVTLLQKILDTGLHAKFTWAKSSITSPFVWHFTNTSSLGERGGTLQSLISSSSPNIAQLAMSMIHRYTGSCHLECVHHQSKTDDVLKPSHCVI